MVAAFLQQMASAANSGSGLSTPAATQVTFISFIPPGPLALKLNYHAMTPFVSRTFFIRFGLVSVSASRSYRCSL